ncbi:hypothetical protein ABZ901_24495 [Actinacidiphila alni]|uniref:hypothetical protein n=1 Tax=Actinacidiphila alni TaxID=380248 RepID=UPI003410C18F
MNALETVLGEIHSATGGSGAPGDAGGPGGSEAAAASGTALIDAATGLTYAEAGDCAAAGSGHDVWRLLTLIEDGLHRAGAEGELESVTVTARRTYHLVRVLPRQGGDPVLLSAVLDREHTNPALAARQLATAAEGLFA